MKKVIKVKQSVRNGKIVKAHTRTINASGNSDQKSGGEFKHMKDYWGGGYDIKHKKGDVVEFPDEGDEKGLGPLTVVKRSGDNYSLKDKKGTTWTYDASYVHKYANKKVFRKRKTFGPGGKKLK